MPTVREIFEFLESRIPRELAAEWDHDGLMCCADLDGKVNRVLLCLDLTKGALEYAEHKHSATEKSSQLHGSPKRI